MTVIAAVFLIEYLYSIVKNKYVKLYFSFFSVLVSFIQKNFILLFIIILFLNRIVLILNKVKVIYSTHNTDVAQVFE